LVFFLDAGKAFLFMNIISQYYSELYLCCFAVIFLIANGCSVFLSGGGGKGVATACGLMFFFYPSMTAILLGIWICLFYCIKVVGIASVGTALSVPLCAMFYVSQPFFYFSVFACLWIVFTHRTNIFMYYKNYCT